MKNRKSTVAIIILLLLVIIAAICWFTLRPEPVEGAKTIIVDVTHSDGTTNTFALHTDAEYLRGALEEAALVEGRESEYGLYVLTVDGETVNEENQEWWGYTKAGAYVEYSVDACVIVDGDHYEFAFHVGW